MSHKTACVLLLNLVAVVLLIVSGCSGDDATGPSDSGTIVINASPESVDAPWILAGPASSIATGNGSRVLTDQTVGDYTVTWIDVPRWSTPLNETRSLAAGATLTFNGVYTELVGNGTIVIDPTPDDIDAPWTLSGPSGYIENGNGDSALTHQVAGDYTLSWGDVAGWDAPAGQTQFLAEDGELTFAGTYTEQVQAGKFVLIDAGLFLMGSPEDEPEARVLEWPRHEVTLTHGFHIQTTEVTNRQFMEMAQWAYREGYCHASPIRLVDALDGSTHELLDLDDNDCEIAFDMGRFSLRAAGWHGVNPDHPVKEVTWYGAVAYCDWLSLREGRTRAYDHSTWQCNGGDPYGATGYRLPTEAEWEYACRAGTQTPFNTGDCLGAGTEANYCGYIPYGDCPAGVCEGWSVMIGSYPANAWGLYDMHGNIWEWCSDIWGEDYYEISPGTDPTGPTIGTGRVVRGGGWSYGEQFSRSAYRFGYAPNSKGRLHGFRVVRTDF